MTKLISLASPELEEFADPRADVHAEAVTNLDAARLRRALLRLPALERRVLVLRYGLDGSGGRTNRQVAQYLQMSGGRAWQIEHRALEQLRQDEGLRRAFAVPEAA